MTFKKFVILMVSGVIFSCLGWLAIVLFTSPQASFWQMSLFYFSLFLVLVGIIFLINLLIRIKVGRDNFYFNYISTSFRQAVLFSVLLTGSLLLQEHHLLTWWNVLFLIGAIALLELFALTKKRRFNLK